MTVDDEFAKSLGLESLAKLRDAVKDRIAREHVGVSRQKLKRALLDELDARHKFEPPPSLVEEEFNRVWKSVLGEMENEKKTFADEGTTEEKAKAEYRAIAERRVRLGLVLAEIGEKNTITVTDEEMNRAVMEQARQFAGQEQRVWDYYRQNPQAVASLRAPIYRGKGGRFPARTCPSDREEGLARGALQGRRCRPCGLSAAGRTLRRAHFENRSCAARALRLI